MRELTVGPGTKVTLHFSLTLANGDVIDSNFERDPATFTVGDGSLLVGFEKAIFGMQEGDRDTFLIKPEEGFGQRNPNNIQEIARDQFSEDIELSEGLMLSFADAQKTELPGVVQRFDDERVIVDFNHPLAGRDILFDVAILRIEPAQVH
ncbi:peptidylprolyl isomerase [Cellvibrio sp. PSBB006]|jgi:FKBP-type peptidyl-prolyl cis-trans isomerase SlpA|uniref:FKBP-type peptidyl-prolyl cis-trans isomerase n=1 Tax=Cellvibrio sp. PSBB006 TaxID=1987723 RepID=UPI000B3B4419|nr:peptidylprolyl isomerase [Cellvibrio sp. PSBB006]ARU27619.1 peptidylprolyl isomerase [Cellvibrio sp. PSBB006]